MLHASNVKRTPRIAPLLLRLATTAALCVAFAAHACTVPVFRYALDRWPADLFRLEAPASAFDQDPVASQLRNLGPSCHINLEASPAFSETEATLSFPNRQKNSAPPLWKGSLNSDTFSALVSSPARKEIAHRICSGDSAVWILVESGNVALDETATELMEARLRFLQQAATLPPSSQNDDNDPSNRIGPGPELKIQLSLLRVRRSDPAESLFLKMLAGPQGLDALPSQQPAAAVVFGRGRVLGIWGEISDDTLEEATLFLLGACSCEVKNLNPGWDLLSDIDWDASLAQAEDLRLHPPQTTATPPPTTPKPAAPVLPETVVFSPGEQTSPPASTQPTSPSPSPSPSGPTPSLNASAPPAAQIPPPLPFASSDQPEDTRPRSPVTPAQIATSSPGSNLKPETLLREQPLQLLLGSSVAFIGIAALALLVARRKKEAA